VGGLGDTRTLQPDPNKRYRSDDYMYMYLHIHVLMESLTSTSSLSHTGFVELWRNGNLTVPKRTIATAYNDTKPVYLKFGIYKGDRLTLGL